MNPTEPTEAQIEELSEEVKTIADEILEEVKECRKQQNETTADLARLREEGQGSSRAYQELLTELKNLREENRSLNQELKVLLEQTPELEPEPSPSSIPLTSPSETVVVVEPSAEEDRAEPAKKKKRYKI